MHGAEFLDNGRLDPLFEATVQATEEAIVNSMVAARDMQGNGGTSAVALPHDALIRPDEALRPGRQHAEVEPVPVEHPLHAVLEVARDREPVVFAGIDH